MALTPDWDIKTFTLDSKEEAYLKIVEEYERAMGEGWRSFFGTLEWAKGIGSYDISKLESEKFEKRFK
jgi:hypothetical protein